MGGICANPIFISRNTCGCGEKLREVLDLAHWLIVLGPYPHLCPYPQVVRLKGYKKAPHRNAGLEYQVTVKTNAAKCLTFRRVLIKATSVLVYP